MNPFTGLHFYYLNKPMAEFLYSNIRRIKYQLDLEIGILAAKKYHHALGNRFIFMNFNTNLIKQSKKFKSDIQYSPISIEQLKKIFKHSEELIELTYEYLPDCYKMKRCDENHNIYYQLL